MFTRFRPGLGFPLDPAPPIGNPRGNGSSPFPWEELRVTEFPYYAGYAQGFPTNISFSEEIGFLTESVDHANAAFFVTAHESAHQWWGNILMPGDGPGGNLLSEGTANFSTILPHHCSGSIVIRSTGMRCGSGRLRWRERNNSKKRTRSH